MLGFGALNMNTSTIIDTYNTVNDKKNDVIATAIANRRSSKDRVGAAAIGATFGVVQTGAFVGAYASVKVFPKLQKFWPLKWAHDKLDKWVKIAQNNNPTRGKFFNFTSAVMAKSIWAIATCALTGLALDMYNKSLSRRLNGKFSNVKQGYHEDSWLLSGLKSMASTKQGKKLIKDSMKATEDGVKIKLKGVNREYYVSKKEIKDASKQYVTFYNEKGKVKGYKKNYSSGDGDVLAFEIALKKYHSDLRNGKIAANSSLPKCANQFSQNDNLGNTDISQIYFFLTGKEPTKIENNFFESNSNENSSINRFITDFSKNSGNIAAGFKFKDDGSGLVKTNSKLLKNVASFSTEKTYAIKKITKKFVTFVDPRNTAVPITIPTEEFKQKFGEIYYCQF